MTNTVQSQEEQELRELCEADLYTFARTVFPDRYYGDVHKEFFHYLQHDKARNKLGLIPRDHQKSHCMAVLATWLITLEPWITINYVSANKDLIEAQMEAIEHVLKTKIHRRLWPQMMNYTNERGIDKHKPTGKWQAKLFQIDHPDREDRAVRDPTIRAATVRSGSTGMHSNVTIYDDLVTDENWESLADKRDVLKCYKNFAKISTTGSMFYAVGTRYGDDDLYAHMMELTYTVAGVEKPMWSVFHRVVEDSPDRTGDGNFVWPRMEMPNGESYGFDEEELAIKKSNLRIDGDVTGFYAQYYNDPNDSSLDRLNRNDFRYYESRLLREEGGVWQYKGEPLKLTAAADLAFTEVGSANAKMNDYTAMAVIGMDAEGFVYLLALERFQTDDYDVYYNAIMDLHDYWGFREITIETNNGGQLVKRYVEDQVRKHGGSLLVNGQATTTNAGKKEERIRQVLYPRYKASTILHGKFGLTKLLEEELVLNRPPHDDLKDVLSIVIAAAKPRLARGTGRKRTVVGNVVNARSRFGGERGRRIR